MTARGPDEIASEPAPASGDLGSLAAVIDARRAEIEQRWLDRIQADVRRAGRDDVRGIELKDAMGDYLAALVDALRRDGDRASLTRSAGSAWADVAREHAITRVRLGFDITQLMHELDVLREIIFDVARERGVLSGDNSERILDLIGAAVALSVATYVESRDYEARKREAEHVGFVTHELRNPLGAAQLALAQLRRGGSGSTSGTATIELLERSLGRLRELVDRVLTTERLEAGQVEPHPARVRLEELLGDALRVARHAAQEKSLELVLEGDTSVELCVDPGLTISALQNLADNAVKFTDSGEVRIVVEELPDEVAIHVFDTCEGIAEEELRTIFEPFRRVHSSKPGTGLGLAIARRATEAQGGTIRAESSSDRGCHFRLNLPKRCPEKPASSKGATP